MPFLRVDLKDPEFNDRKFSVTKAYYQSKRAQVMYTYWLAKKLERSNITANCIRVPSVQVDIGKYADLPSFLRLLYSLKMRSALAPDEMARTYTYLATSNDVGQISGTFFDEKHRPASSSRYSRDPENIEQVMKLTTGDEELAAAAAAAAAEQEKPTHADL